MHIRIDSCSGLTDTIGQSLSEAEDGAELEELEREHIFHVFLTYLITSSLGRALELANAYAPPDARRSPVGSPTHVGTQYRPSASHVRQESETLRSLETASTPTAVEPPNRNFPPSTLAASTASNIARHRRSPPALDNANDGYGVPASKAWAVDEGRGDPEERRSDEYLRVNGHLQPAVPQTYSSAMPPPPVPLQQTKSLSSMPSQSFVPAYRRPDNQVSVHLEFAHSCPFGCNIAGLLTFIILGQQAWLCAP